MMDFSVTPYRICVSIYIGAYICQSVSHTPKQKGRHCLLIWDMINHSEYSFRQLIEMVESACHAVHDNATPCAFRIHVENTTTDVNWLYAHIKQIRDNERIENNSVAGLFLRKLAIYFDRLTHQACSILYDDLLAYVAMPNMTLRKKGLSVTMQSPRTTKSSTLSADNYKYMRPIHQISHEVARLQANEQRAMSPKDLYESVRRPNNSCKSDASFLRYLNLLRVNECVGSKHLLMAYFDMVSDSVSRSYSSLNYAIWYLHHGEYKRAIECLQECYCCAQAADDDKCLLISLMWLARIVIQAKQKNSSKYNVTALLELVKKRSHKANMPYVQAMSSMTLEQLIGPVDDSKLLKKSSETLKQVALNSRQPYHPLANSNQNNPLDKDDTLPSAEILAVRHSMNDVLAMYYALVSAHLSLVDSNQSSALASQTLLHFDLIEKCGNEDVFLINENTFIAIRNLAFHVWNSTGNIIQVRELLIDLCSKQIPVHRTDNHSIWRQALSEISFEYYIEQENFYEASKMISVIRETDQDGAQLCQVELLKRMGVKDEALQQVDELIMRIEAEESDLDGISLQTNKALIKSKALLQRAILLDDECGLLKSLQFATENRFLHVRTACLMHLGHWSEDIIIELFANGTQSEKTQLRLALKNDSRA